jgi:photosystem II protein PsbQ
MIMTRYRSLLAVILAAVMTFLVSCSSPSATQPPTYTPEKIARIEQVAAPLAELRDRMATLERKIVQRNWTDVGTYIHGPLGELRRTMSLVTRELLPQEQKAATATAKDLFSRLETIDLATSDNDYQKAIENYRLAVKDFDAFLRLLPQPSESGLSG